MCRSMADCGSVSSKTYCLLHLTKKIRYMALSDLYARDMHFRFDKVVLCIIIMVSYVLGHVFMIFLTAIHDLKARGVLM
jgi:hypothetical protein